MSIEQLLFFLILIAIPLLERLVRVMRARTDRSPSERTSARDDATAARPRATVPVADADASERQGPVTELPLPESSLPPALPQAVRDAAPRQLPASERKRRSSRKRTQDPVRSVRSRHSASPTVPRRVVTAGDLRRGIVLTAILGPCRAIEPKDASSPG